MSGIKDNDNIDNLRKRLYERGNPVPQRHNHELQDSPKEVPTSWSRPNVKSTPAVPAQPQPATQSQARTESAPSEPLQTRQAVPQQPPESTPAFTMPTKKKSRYRIKIIIAGMLFFVAALMVSSFIMLFGNNTISGENISLAVTGPFTIGGGEVLPLQVAISNDNSVPIQSATLIVEYPAGTLANGEENRQLFNERLPLDVIAAGESVNVPLRAVVFGEENQEKTVNVSIEYRVEGSNARFFKEAEPLRFKISSSPVSIRADALQQISSGQSTDVTVTITSNAPTTLSDVLVQAEYPIGFDFESSQPRPFSGENTWLIEDLEPETSQTVVISGVVIGKETDEYAINFTVGVPGERERDRMASMFGAAQTEFEIEQPFLNVSLAMGNVVNDTKVVEPGQKAYSSVEITNTLDDTIYDIVVTAALGGNAIADLEVGPPNGFYDSNTDTITWDVSNSPNLQELEPGDSLRVAFSLEPETIAQTPEVTIDVNVEARRVRESQAAETLIGTASGAVRVVSSPDMSSTVTHGSGPFSDDGPLPPRAEEATDYTLTLMVENGSNDIANAVTTAVLPTYVTWNDETVGDGIVSYNSVTRRVTWSLGKLDANQNASASFQVTARPSQTQIGQTPVLLDEQQFTAEDTFTETTIRDTYPARTTEMSLETGFEKENGRVME